MMMMMIQDGKYVLYNLLNALLYNMVWSVMLCLNTGCYILAGHSVDGVLKF